MDTTATAEAVGARVDLGADGVVDRVDGSIPGICGPEGRDLGGRPLAAYVHPDDRPEFRAAVTNRGDGGPDERRVRLRLRSQDGYWHWTDVLLRAASAGADRWSCELTWVPQPVVA